MASFRTDVRATTRSRQQTHTRDTSGTPAWLIATTLLLAIALGMTAPAASWAQDTTEPSTATDTGTPASADTPGEATATGSAGDGEQGTSDTTDGEEGTAKDEPAEGDEPTLSDAGPELAEPGLSAERVTKLLLSLLAFVALIAVSMYLGDVLARKRWRMPEHQTRTAVVIFCLLASIVIVAAGGRPKLGIDLSGGVILVYGIEGSTEQATIATTDTSDEPGDKEGKEGETDTDDEKEEAAPKPPPYKMKDLVAALVRRINPGGVKEVTIRQFGPNQIEIIVPEADQTEVERLKRMISQAGTLAFRILANETDHRDIIKRAESVEGREVVDLDGNPIAWWIPVAKGKEENVAKLGTPGTRVRADETTEVLVVADAYNVTGDYLSSSKPGIDDRGTDCVNFTFGTQGSILFYALTSGNKPDPVSGFKRSLGIVLDGKLHSAPSLNSPIRSRGQITGGFTREEVSELVGVLNAGKLPAKLSETPISEMQSGPTLGRETIRKSSIAIAISLVSVLVFMAFYYRFSGLVACGALLMTLMMILAVMITVSAAFTLPGLAGLVLTVGIAVDANVLIFERIREELDREATLRMAIRNGFGRATSAIVDANLTTLFTATILFAIGTEQVKGFAVTLWLGVAFSMFTAIYCSRLIFDVAERQKWITTLSMRRILGTPKIDFLSMRSMAAIASAVVILIGLTGVVLRGKSLLDIDFTGGVKIQALFAEAQTGENDVKEPLADKLEDLAVSEVFVTGEPRGTRYNITTAEPPDWKPEGNVKQSSEAYLRSVKAMLEETFGKKLKHHAMSFEVNDTPPILDLASPVTPDQPEPVDTTLNTPIPTFQPRDDLPPDTLLASTDLSSFLLAQVDTTEDPAPEPPVDPMEPVVEPMEPPVDPMEPVVEPMEPVVEPMEPPVEPMEPPVDPMEPPVDPMEPPVEPMEPPVDPMEPVVEPMEPPVDPMEPPVEPMEPVVEPMEPPVEPMEPPVEPMEPPVEPMEPPVEPMEPPVEPMEPPVEPMEPPVEPMEPPVEPMEPPVEPMEPPVEPMEPPVEPMEPPVEPMEPPVEPMEPPVEPMEPPVEPMEPPVEPMEPPVEPMEPPVEPMEPPVEPMEPPVEPMEPPVEPTEPTSDPVEPVTSELPTTKATLQFENKVSAGALGDMIDAVAATEGWKQRAVIFHVRNGDFEGEGVFRKPIDDMEACEKWRVEFRLPAESTSELLSLVKQHVEQEPVFEASANIGGAVAEKTRTQGIIALVASLVVIVLYLWIRFQKVMYGLAAVVALVHDVLITLGMLALSAYLAPVFGWALIEEFKIGLPVLAAFLTIIGYSLNDTIVVFDRIREIRGKAPNLTGEMINKSINQTLSRTMLTSMTTLIVVLILYIGGGDALRSFAFALLIGVMVGTYSSIFVASPVLYWMSKAEDKRS